MCYDRQDYVKNVLKVRREDEKEYLDTMDKYSCDWWNSTDPAQIVRYQLTEPVLLVLISKLQNALEMVLKRPVKPEEISYVNVSLKVEVYTALGLT